MTLYERVGRALAPLAKLFLRLSTLVTRQQRTRILLLDGQGNILLLRGWLSSGKWELPGGGIKRNEPGKIAAQRELFEETGIKLIEDDLTYLGNADAPSYIAQVYAAHAPQKLLPTEPHNVYEIIALEWYSIQHLPKNRSVLIDKALALLAKSS